MFQDHPHFLPYIGVNQDPSKLHSINTSLHQREEWNYINGPWDSDQFFRVDSTVKRPVTIDVQDTNSNSILFGFGIADKCTRQEKILKLLSSGSSEVVGGLLNLSILLNLVGPDVLFTDLPQEPLASYHRWHLSGAFSQQSLIYPTRESYFENRMVDVKGDIGSSGITYHSDGQLSVAGSVDMNDVLSVIAEFYLSKSTVKSSKQSMLVPFFERRRRASAKSVVETVKTAPLNSPEKVKGKISQKKKSNRKPGEERDIYGNKYLFACESLLSIMANRKQNGKSAIFSLKKSGPELPQLLTQFSASIAGTGIAVLFSVVCKVACGRVPFCASKILNTGLGLGLVWLSWAIHKLRNTVISISKNSGKLALKEEEMMNNLDKSLKDIYFRIAALMAVTVLRLA
ncbi:Hypothetical predicted protein [Olea europaea subsp. europaea]|uniref:Uncharacterized protein n=1 Tax=Olea europaea subsp. europaea TaxID=158383 RepID=A0A8S0S776_OLEEU|nr:Hypothetical predicted protein [Olea europaea subsp. europaea]